VQSVKIGVCVVPFCKKMRVEYNEKLGKWKIRLRQRNPDFVLGNLNTGAIYDSQSAVWKDVGLFAFCKTKVSKRVPKGIVIPKRHDWELFVPTGEAWDAIRRAVTIEEKPAVTQKPVIPPKQRLASDAITLAEVEAETRKKQRKEPLHLCQNFGQIQHK
jgi:hypothetical protein